MNRKPTIQLFIAFFFLFTSNTVSAQLQVTEVNNATALAQKLVGDGVIISNAVMTLSPSVIPTGFFNNLGGTNINIDSGIVLTSGRAKTDFRFTNRYGVDGDGTFPASARRADNNLGLPGDLTLANELGIPISQLNDAIALEFDFVPLGDSIKFNYILSSEEYTPGTVCVFNDAFGFFISGPGIIGTRNIALIPGTSTPVTITNVNNIITAGCVNNPLLYVDNQTNIYFVHEGHTKVFTAVSNVQPCETYHLKLVIADRGDHLWDSGVFLQARSLTSNAIGMTNLTQTDPEGNSYLVEGCATGAFNIRRPRRDPTALNVTLSFGGTALNGIDYQPLPQFVTIPANDSFVTVNLIPIIDGMPEGIEHVIVYALAGCTAGTPTDSTIIQIRDYDTLSIAPGSTFICKNSSVQLNASGSYTNYQWNPDPSLSNPNIRNPIATPTTNSVTYICTAIEGTCHARDSVHLQWKDMEFVSKQNINCRGGVTGNISVAAGPEWQAPVEFSIDGINWQTDSNFYNLPVGSYTVRTRDANCIDSMIITLAQAFPDLIVAAINITPASCTGDADGMISVTGGGGNSVYQYSSDGINFQASDIFNLPAGNYSITIKDGNGCTVSQPANIALNNIVTLDASPDTSICNGTSYLIPAVSNAATIDWTPASTLSNGSILNPVASPSVTTLYFVTATTGLCSRRDSITVAIWPAPVADAGPDITVCYGKIIQLNGSGGVSYQWSPTTNFITPGNIAAPSLRAKQNQVYTLMVKDARGCSSIQPDAVSVQVTPAVKIFAGRDTVAAINQPIQLQAVELGTAGVSSYSWTPGTFLNNASIATPIATLPYDYRFVVTGTTPDGCEGMDDILIKVYLGPDIYVPTGFTPDNNGTNDILRAIPVGMKEFKYFRVFNRWGQLIFSTQDSKRGWDGRINGIVQPTGTFIWLAEAIDFKGNLINRKGFVTIIR